MKIWNKIGKKIDGSILAIFIFDIPSIFKASPTINKLPTALISDITAVVNTPDNKFAPNVITPWYKKTVIAENITPIPNVEVKIIDDIKSNIDLANKVSWFPFNPLSKDPTIAIAPTQNNKLEDINPSDIDILALFFFLNFPSKKHPNLSIHISISILSPINEPKVIHIIMYPGPQLRPGIFYDIRN